METVTVVAKQDLLTEDVVTGRPLSSPSLIKGSEYEVLMDADPNTEEFTFINSRGTEHTMLPLGSVDEYGFRSDAYIEIKSDKE